MKRLRLLAPLAALLMLTACMGQGGLASLLGAGAPPQASASVQRISRGAIDFALHSFDAALYGLDFAMDSGRITPGSDGARRIARAGRTVMSFLGAADAAQRLGHAASYEEAFASANTALNEFRAAIGAPATPAALWIGATRIGTEPGQLRPLTDRERRAILDRLDGGHPTV